MFSLFCVECCTSCLSVYFIVLEQRRSRRPGFIQLPSGWQLSRPGETLSQAHHGNPLSFCVNALTFCVLHVKDGALS